MVPTSSDNDVYNYSRLCHSDPGVTTFSMLILLTWHAFVAEKEAGNCSRLLWRTTEDQEESCKNGTEGFFFCEKHCFTLTGFGKSFLKHRSA